MIRYTNAIANGIASRLLLLPCDLSRQLSVSGLSGEVALHMWQMHRGA